MCFYCIIKKYEFLLLPCVTAVRQYVPACVTAVRQYYRRVLLQLDSTYRRVLLQLDYLLLCVTAVRLPTSVCYYS